MELLGFGIFLAIVGAVLKVAVKAENQYLDLSKTGQILLYSGIAISVIGLALTVLDRFHGQCGG
jgi:hypothetical protein